MATANKILGLYGSGRVARHMQFYFESLGWQVENWSRRVPRRSTQPLALVGVAVSDDAIGPVIAELQLQSSLGASQFFHFSGSLILPQAFSFHPFLSFGPDLYEKDFYPRIAFSSEKPVGQLKAFFPDFPNPLYTVPAAERPYYHALCVMASSHTVLLWQKFFGEMQARYGLQPEDLKLSLDRVFLNLRTNPATALTGPFPRGDEQTIQKNIEALRGDPFAAVYLAFLKAYRESPQL